MFRTSVKNPAPAYRARTGARNPGLAVRVRKSLVNAGRVGTIRGRLYRSRDRFLRMSGFCAVVYKYTLKQI